jgi:hypothetical protein
VPPGDVLSADEDPEGILGEEAGECAAREPLDQASRASQPARAQPVRRGLAAALGLIEGDQETADSRRGSPRVELGRDYGALDDVKPLMVVSEEPEDSQAGEDAGFMKEAGGA